jgi:hypothetical protein
VQFDQLASDHLKTRSLSSQVLSARWHKSERSERLKGYGLSLRVSGSSTFLSDLSVALGGKNVVVAQGANFRVVRGWERYRASGTGEFFPIQPLEKIGKDQKRADFCRVISPLIIRSFFLSTLSGNLAERISANNRGRV